MRITREIADRIYTVLVETIDTPDIDYRRWSFTYAAMELNLIKYRLDSKLGATAVLLMEKIPVIQVTEVLSIQQQRLMQDANSLIREIVRPKRAKVIRPIRVAPAASSVTIPVVQVPSLATVSQQLQ